MKTIYKLIYKPNKNKKTEEFDNKEDASIRAASLYEVYPELEIEITQIYTYKEAIERSN